MRETSQIANLSGSVNRAHFRCLGNRNDARLHVMLVANVVISVTDRVDGELTVGCRKVNQLAPREFFRSTTLIGMDVCGVGADHGVKRLRHRFQAQAIGSSAIENNEHFNVSPEMLLELTYCGSGVMVVAIADDVSPVDRCDGLQNSWMNAGVVVAGKTTDGFHT